MNQNRRCPSTLWAGRGKWWAIAGIAALAAVGLAALRYHQLSRAHIRQMWTQVDMIALQGGFKRIVIRCGAFPVGAGQVRALGVSCDDPSPLYQAMVDILACDLLCDAFGNPYVLRGLPEAPDDVDADGPPVPAECLRDFGEEWARHAELISRGADGRLTPMEVDPEEWLRIPFSHPETDIVVRLKPDYNIGVMSPANIYASRSAEGDWPLGRFTWPLIYQRMALDRGPRGWAC